jgi:hypothetical protein
MNLYFSSHCIATKLHIYWIRNEYGHWKVTYQVKGVATACKGIDVTWTLASPLVYNLVVPFPFPMILKRERERERYCVCPIEICSQRLHCLPFLIGIYHTCS